METKLLLVNGDELSRLLGEVLQPEKCEHEFKDDFYGFWDTTCTKCDRGWHYKDDNVPEQCEASAIPLDDFNVAMKWRDWAVKEYGKQAFTRALIQVVYPDKNIVWDAVTTQVLTISTLSFIAIEAKPEHYLIAAALCKLKGKE